MSAKYKGSNTTENKNAVINEARGKYTTYYNKNKSKPKYVNEFSSARKNKNPRNWYTEE